MDDLISRRDAIDALKHLSKNYAGIGRREYHPHIDFVIDVITMLPSVTPKPKTGRWVYTGDYITDGMLKCSECGFEHDVSERFLYCPNCGSYMEVKE